MMKTFFTIFLLIVLFSCSEIKNENSTEIKNNKIINRFENIKPIHTDRGQNIYIINQIIFSLDTLWHIEKSISQTKADFSTFQLIGYKDTIGIYIGGFPDYPEPMNRYVRYDKKIFFDTTDFVNGKFVSKQDALVCVATLYDSLPTCDIQPVIFQAYKLKEKYIIARFAEKSGQIDIGISFENERNLNVHLFGIVENENASQRIVDIAKSVSYGQ